MHYARDIVSKHPEVKGNINEALVRCSEEVLACAQTCIACGDACLGGQTVKELTQCIRLNLDGADICAATAALTIRRTGSNEAVMRQVIEICATACRTCAEECERHASRHDHCRICAESCRRCEQACQEAARTITP